MTNFRKWRDSLTVVDFVELMRHKCYMCPIPERECYPSCMKRLNQWAEQEVEE